LSDATGKDSRRSAGGRNDKSPKSKPSAEQRAARSKSASDLGKALRTVYDSTLVERVPDDFLDLLGKLS